MGPTRKTNSLSLKTQLGHGRGPSGVASEDAGKTKREAQEESLNWRAFQSAYNSIIRALSRRDHSEKELRMKLLRYYDKSSIEAALDRARSHGYLRSPEELAERTVRALLRRKKSAGYIRQFLKTRGLPASEVSTESETINARTYLERRFGPAHDMVYDQKKKAALALKARGFSTTVIKAVLYGK